MNPCVSVIIPVYNVEKYIHRCVDSVLAQTLDNIEIILVDDGSPDGSPAICDEYAKKDPRVKVIHKENGGLASARNAGMKVAAGEYMFFVDSDDWLEEDGLEILYNKAKETGVDFVKYRAIRSFWPGKPEHTPVKVEPIRELVEGLYDRERIVSEIYPRLFATNQLTMGAVVGAWGALYKTEYIQNHSLYFDEDIKYSEDVIFSAKIVKEADSFYFLDTSGIYHYFYNPDSISKSFREGRWESCKRLIDACEREFADDSEYDFTDELCYLRWFCILLALGERKRLKTYKERLSYCRKIIRDPYVKDAPLVLSKISVSKKQKTLMRLIRMGFARLVART